MFPYDMTTDSDPVLFFVEVEALIGWPRDPDTRSRFLCVTAGAQAQLSLARAGVRATKPKPHRGSIGLAPGKACISDPAAGACWLPHPRWRRCWRASTA